ncbi:Glycosyltransferase involved in cell wall bisynthesis [Arenibacter troitsensis]|uniref:Glycosyltransferase involved in cell wall bisynthesis n=1 Tax=Arenibacter troitsensis TaxID=188872 RepID=A0A1X7KQV8_9FLAO|nr:Glycosyltransferase involved in cell wall bisynthesis [Arenibacter troitsensis]
MENQKSKILFLIQFPPPVHGVSVINKHIFNLSIFDEEYIKDVVELKFSEDLTTLSKLNLKKVLRTLKIAYELLLKGIKIKPQFVYFTISPANNTFYRDLIFVFIIKLLRIKPIYHLHGKGISDNVQKNPFVRNIYKWVFNNSAIIHLSDGLVRRELHPLQLKNAIIYVLPNGIINQYPIQTFPITEKKDDVLFLSNLFPSKGIFILLQAIKLVKDHIPTIKVNIVGDTVNNQILREVKRLIVKYKLEQNVIIHGKKLGKEKSIFLENTKIFVHPTLNDAFPLVILEALQNGLPVITTNEGAIPEIIDDETGIIIQKNDPEQLALKIISLLSDQEHLKTLSKNCVDQFNERYTASIFNKNVHKIFMTIINKKIND